MGVKIFELIPTKEIELKDLKDKVVAIDAPLILYQFLTTIRQRDGSLLMDSNGNVTSHLTGLFSRLTNFLKVGIRPCFVFDGKPPLLKKEEREKRAAIKKEAERNYKQAELVGDIDGMKKYASRTTRLTKEHITESMELLKAFGVPVIQAPSEGEAQAAHIVKKGDAYAVGSQDADCFMFGASRLVKNLSVTGKRKKTGALSYTIVKPELIELDKVLNSLGIDGDQLIALGMLIGTDYNNKGIKGIGPKKALQHVTKFGKDFNSLFKEVKWDEHFDISWEKIFNTIKNMPITSDYGLKWTNPDAEKIKDLLVEKHDFSLERVENSLKKILAEQKKKNQKGLGDFF